MPIPISAARLRWVVPAACAAVISGAFTQSAFASTAPEPALSLSLPGDVIGAPAAWAAGATGHGIDVAVLDTGVTPVAGLSGSDKLVYGPDLSFDSQDPDHAFIDGYGHGTAMASIIGGNDGTATGYKGVAPDSRIVSVKVGASNGAVDVSQMIAGIDWVTAHAHDNGLNIRVLNLSLGTSSTQSATIDPLAHAAEQAWKQGIVVVVAVGNDGVNTKNVATPATDPYVLAVGADDARGTVDVGDDSVATFSQRGTDGRHADVVAPGTYIMGLASPGSVLAVNNPGAVFDDRYLRGSGTSHAAAVTSGVVADLLSARPDLTPDEVKAVLKSTAVDVTTRDTNFDGEGVVQLPAALAAAVPAGSTQTYASSTGTGSLEAARGSSHVILGGVALTGEQDIFGQPWSADAAWAGGTFNGSTWSGNAWTGSTWSGNAWTGSTWSGNAWTGSTWSGSTWSGSTWSGSTWSGSTWSGSTWSGSTWSGSTWSGSTWSGSTWSGSTWSGSTWMGSSWT